MPKISMIMPVYNCQDYVSEAIESVLAQTWEQWELIIVDDGSTDKSGNICDRYAREDARIRVFHCANSGVSSARNRGIQEATGEYIEFIDGDDILNKEAMETLIREMESARQKPDLIIFRFQTFPKKTVPTISDRQEINGIAELAEHFDLVFANHHLNSPGNKLFRRSVILENHLTFPADMSMGEDLMFNLAYLKCIERILLIPDVLYNYRRNNANSLTSAFRPDMLDTKYRSKGAIDDTFANHELVRNRTDKMFADALIDEIKAVSYQDRLTRSEKKALIETWLNNPDYSTIYFRSTPSRSGAPMDYLVRTRKIDLMISLYRIRKLLSSILHTLERCSICEGRQRSPGV